MTWTVEERDGLYVIQIRNVNGTNSDVITLSPSRIPISSRHEFVGGYTARIYNENGSLCMLVSHSTVADVMQHVAYPVETEEIGMGRIILSRRVGWVEEKEGFVPHGLQQEWYESGRRKRITTFVNGMLHGAEVVWRENGSAEHIREWVNGELTGWSVLFFDSGRVQSLIGMRNGRMHGPCVAWYANGLIRQVKEYRDGEQILG